MTTFSREEVRRLATLARLELSDTDVERFTRQLRDILEFEEQVNAVDTSSIPEATPGPADPADDRTREDLVRPSLDRDAALSLAPDADREAGLFKVPRVLNG